MVEIAQMDEPDFGEISRVIRADPVVSGKILKTANSALFGFRHKIESIEHAIPKLGITLLRTLILGFHLARHKTHQQQLEPVFQDLWRCSLTQAAFAELIAEEFLVADPPTSFLAAMLQDIGILAMVSEAPADYLATVLSRSSFPNVAAAERSHFGFSHVDVSTEIIKQWGLEESFGDAIRHHHDKVVSSKPNPAQRLKVVLQAANLGTAVLFTKRSSATSLNSSLDQWIGFMEFHFGLTGMQAEQLITEVDRRVVEYSTLFKFNIGEGSDSEDAVAAAMEMLQEIALKNQVELMSRKRPKLALRDEDNELYRDSLSGLYNRRFMNEHLSDRLAKRIKKKKPIALLFLDVDKFKTINDSYGHSAGDQAIRHVASWLTQSIRNDDLAIRLGGDEFLVILQSVKEDHFEKIANRIVQEVPPFELPGAKHIDVSLSVGCAIYQPVRGDATDANWLIDQADQSMYQAKKAGGNSVSVQKFTGSQLASVK